MGRPWRMSGLQLQHRLEIRRSGVGLTSMRMGILHEKIAASPCSGDRALEIGCQLDQDQHNLGLFRLVSAIEGGRVSAHAPG